MTHIKEMNNTMLALADTKDYVKGIIDDFNPCSIVFICLNSKDYVEEAKSSGLEEVYGIDLESADGTEIYFGNQLFDITVLNYTGVVQCEKDINATLLDRVFKMSKKCIIVGINSYDAYMGLVSCAAKQHFYRNHMYEQKWNNNDAFLFEVNGEYSTEDLSLRYEEILYKENRRAFSNAKDNNIVRNDNFAAEVYWHEKYDAIDQSTFWRMTKPLRLLADELKNRKKEKKKTREGKLPTTRNNVDAVRITDLKVTEHPIRPIPTKPDFSNIDRVNLVTNSLEKDYVLGGVATALVLATVYANRSKKHLRIITRNSKTDPSMYYEIVSLLGIEPCKNVSFYTDFNSKEKLSIGSKDIFISTSWWSSKALKSMGIKKFFYLIQEVETFFYPEGSERYACSEIMNDEDLYYIVNSQYLFDYFKISFPIITQRGVYFKPAFPYSLYSKSFEEKREGKYKLFFYSRPLNPRNMFFKGIELLNEMINRGVINTDRWNIYLVGQDVPNIVFDNGYHPYTYGRLTWKEYGSFLKCVDIGMCLMITPHPSYVPYDVAASGAVAITNKAYNKTEIVESENIVTSDLSLNEFEKNLKYAIELAEDENRRKMNYHNDSIPRDWEKAISCAIDYMMEREKCLNWII